MSESIPGTPKQYHRAVDARDAAITVWVDQLVNRGRAIQQAEAQEQQSQMQREQGAGGGAAQTGSAKRPLQQQ